MPDDTTAAIQALIQQVASLTETVQKQDEIIRGVKDYNDRLLDKVKDDKRTNIVALAAKQEKERQMRADGFVPNEDGTWRLASGPGDKGGTIILTREQARNPQTYREAKARADAQGVPLRIASDGQDPTMRSNGKAPVIQSKTFSFDDTHDGIRYVRHDMHSGDGMVQRQMAAEREGLKLRTFRTLDDLPAHARQKFELMEAAANADGNT
ncbi:MAG: hypothetical protein H5U14_17390 [Roseovarius sp.]|nr:hypothetical protein [Roseovarius sp.]